MAEWIFAKTAGWGRTWSARRDSGADWALVYHVYRTWQVVAQLGAKERARGLGGAETSRHQHVKRSKPRRRPDRSWADGALWRDISGLRNGIFVLENGISVRVCRRPIGVGEDGVTARKSLFDKGLDEFASHCRVAVQGRFGDKTDSCENDRAGAGLERAQVLRGRLAARMSRL